MNFRKMYPLTVIVPNLCSENNVGPFTKFPSLDLFVCITTGSYSLTVTCTSFHLLRLDMHLLSWESNIPYFSSSSLFTVTLKTGGVESPVVTGSNSVPSIVCTHSLLLRTNPIQLILYGKKS